MFAGLGDVKKFIKLSEVSIDNGVFKLHYKATVAVLVTCSLLITSKQYLGDPIDCVVEEIPQEVMDTYCWIHSTYTVTNMVGGEPGKEVAHAGVAPPSHAETDEDIRYHKYYQWVCFTLFFQAILFYIPWYIWKYLENGKVKMLVQEMRFPMIGDEDGKNDRISTVIHYMEKNKGSHSGYAWKFFTCEVLNFINILGQIFFTDMFLGGEFTTYGSDVLNMSEQPPQDRYDPMADVFPKVTKCTFHKFGPSGTVENFDGLCILPLNIINEKIYIFLWYWFIIVCIISGIQLIMSLLRMFVPRSREFMVKYRARGAPMNEIEGVCSNLSAGDWFIMYQIGKNMDPLIFRDFLHNFNKELNGEEGRKLTTA